MKRTALNITMVVVVLAVIAIVAAGLALFHERNSGTLSPAAPSTVAGVEPGSVAWENSCMYTSDLAAAEKDPKDVCSLNLFNQKLTAIPAAVFTMTNLEYLNLADNNITDVPSDIGNLTHLKWLYLNQNPIASLPDTISQLTNLELLAVEYDSINSLPGTIEGMKSIQAIIVQGNPLPPPELSRLKSVFAQASIVD